MGLGFRVEAQRRLREGSERSRMAPRGSEKAQRRLREGSEESQRRLRGGPERHREGSEKAQRGPVKSKKEIWNFGLGLGLK